MYHLPFFSCRRALGTSSSRSAGTTAPKARVESAACFLALLLITPVLAADSATGADAETRGEMRPLDRDEALVLPRDAEREVGAATVIQGDQLEMIADDHEARFIFTDNIRVTGSNIVLTCDRLEVLSSRGNQRDESEERLAGMGRIRSIVASGRVHVSQEGREATAGRAEVLPDEGRVILTESPVIRDAQGEVSGERIILYQGLERAVVESSAKRPARVTLPTLPDLGFRDQERPNEEEDSPE